MRRPAKASLAGSKSTIGSRLAMAGLACVCVLVVDALSTAGAFAADYCPNAAVRGEQGTAALASCRAYEMVSPPDKNNGDVLFQGTARTSTDGSALQFETSSAFGGAKGAAHSNQYISRRTDGGWTTEALNPYQTPDGLAPIVPSEGFYAFDADLTTGVLVNNHDPNDAPGDLGNDVRSLYRWQQGGVLQRLTPKGATTSPFDYGPLLAGSSSDFSRFFFESPSQLLPAAPPYANQAYEWNQGQLAVIGRLPGGEVAPEGAMIGAGVSTNGGEERRIDPRAAISPKGTEVVLAMGSPSQLYLRKGEQSKLISVSRRSGDLGTPAEHGATFLGSASSNGEMTTVYFASPDLLTEDAQGDPAEWEANGLYAYDVESEDLSFLSPDTNPGDGSTPRVTPQFFASGADGRYLYFFCRCALTPDAPSGGDGALYVVHDGSLAYTGLTASSGIPAPRLARVSRDGSRLLMQIFPDNQPDPESMVSVPTAPEPYQAYLFDATSRKWTCVSCSRDEVTTHIGLLKGFLLSYGGAPNYHRAGNLSPDGRRVYFETAEALVSEDVNDQVDVYEWNEGQVNLISTGMSPSAAHFIEAAADGSSVFFATRDRLVDSDVDNNIDAYVARTGGGFLSSRSAPCQGDSCQGPPRSAPAWASSASGQLAEGRNQKPRRVPRCSARKGESRSAKARARPSKQSCAKRKKRASKAKARNANGKQVGR